MPEELVTVCRISPVSRFSIWTVALGIRAPVWSRMVPFTCAESNCARRGVLASRQIVARIRVKKKPTCFLRDLGSLPVVIELIERVLLFTVFLLNNDRPQSLAACGESSNIVNRRLELAVSD